MSENMRIAWKAGMSVARREKCSVGHTSDGSKTFFHNKMEQAVRKKNSRKEGAAFRAWRDGREAANVRRVRRLARMRRQPETSLGMPRLVPKRKDLVCPEERFCGAQKRPYRSTGVAGLAFLKRERASGTEARTPLSPMARDQRFPAFRSASSRVAYP